MKIFISHSSKNKEIVLVFSRFLESLQNDIQVFCSSEVGAIPVGKDFVKEIFSQLSDCDLFIPVLSKEYFESKFCMIELGVAYSYYYADHEHNNDGYISPFVLPPLRAGDALSGTPLAYLEAVDISNREEISEFINVLASEHHLSFSLGRNARLNEYIFNANKMLLDELNILGSARIGAYFDDSVRYPERADIVSHSSSTNGIVVNYNMNPDEEAKVIRPNFISLVLRYVDFIDMGRYLEYIPEAQLCFTLKNFTNSLKRVHVEFKHSENNTILDTFVYELQNGDNTIRIPLHPMSSNAFHKISEICFVIHPEDVVEEEGMFEVCNIEVK